MAEDGLGKACPAARAVFVDSSETRGAPLPVSRPDGAAAWVDGMSAAGGADDLASRPPYYVA